MKNLVLGIVTILLGIIITLTTVTITGAMNRDIELEDALKIATNRAIENCTSRYNYSLDDNYEFAAALLMELSNEIENDASLNVEIMGIDKDKGYLSLRVTENYITATGQEKSAICETSAYLDRGDTSGIIQGVKVTFFDIDGCYLGEQTLNQGETIKSIITPSRAGLTFDGWINADDKINCGTNLGIAKKETAFIATYR